MEIRNSIKKIKHKEVLNSAEEKRIQTSQKKRFFEMGLNGYMSLVNEQVGVW